MTTQIKTLYEQDFYLWLEETIKLLEERQLSAVDLPHLIEELIGMSNSERSALESNLTIILMHLLKYAYQPEKRSSSWRVTIREHRRRISKAFKKSPSLKRYFAEVFEECYQDARALAADETMILIERFPAVCPFTPDESLNPDYLPN